MHLSDHVIHVEHVSVLVGLKVGKVEEKKNGKLSLCLALPYGKRMGWGGE